MGEYKKKLNKQRQNFLLSFFDKESDYSEKQVNGFWLVKQWNDGLKEFQVAIYTEESFKKYKELYGKIT